MDLSLLVGPCCCCGQLRLGWPWYYYGVIIGDCVDGLLVCCAACLMMSMISNREGKVIATNDTFMPPNFRGGRGVVNCCVCCGSGRVVISGCCGGIKNVLDCCVCCGSGRVVISGCRGGIKNVLVCCGNRCCGSGR